MKDVVSDEARAHLERWPVKARRLFAELLEDAGSDLQRELLNRALAAGHTSPEVHAFADELRGMSDDEAFEACTLDDAAPEDYTVTQLLRAEADPLFAYELRGGELSPAEEEASPAPPPAPKRHEEAEAPVDALAMGVARKKKGFEAESSPAQARAPRMDWNDLGGPAVAESRPVSGTHSALAPTARLLEDLLTEATRALAVSWREHEVDTERGMKLEDVIPSAASALTRGIPVPLAIGPRPGDSRRFVLLLQLSTSGKNRAWQLYDPFTLELVWANEGDLLARAELPFANKANRRITRVVLPSSQRSSF